MDYELRIKLVETELKHLQEMQKLGRERPDTIDISIDKLLLLAKTNTEAIAELTANVNSLVSALLRQHPNGK